MLRKHSTPKQQELDLYYLGPFAYYVFSPLAELDLHLNNHPGNPHQQWEFYGNNWP